MTITTFLHTAIPSLSLRSKEIQLFSNNLEDVTCPICLDFPHNAVLLQCSSYHKGCQPFMCDTGQSHSNCLDRFKASCNISTNWASGQALCPLCRGNVTGYVTLLDARTYLNMKKRTCEENNCSYMGSYLELKEHTRAKHPHSRPSEIDPARKLDWENFQQSSEIVDVLSTIQAEIPHGVVLGDYVIEYGSDENGVTEYGEFHRRKGRWWNFCLVFRFKVSRNRQRSRGSSSSSSTRRGQNQSSSDNGSPRFVDIRHDDDFVEMSDAISRQS